MPRVNPTRKPPKILPFSLILEPEELRELRRLAQKEGTSIGALVRRAIGVVIEQRYPDRRRRMIEQEAEEFLNTLAQRYPDSFLTAAKRRQFKQAAVKYLT